MTDPLAHVPQVINPEQQCFECARVFILSDLDDNGRCAECVETAAYSYAAGCLEAIEQRDLETAKFCAGEVACLRPEHAAALEGLGAALSDGSPVPEPALVLLAQLAAKYQPSPATPEWAARAFFAALSKAEHAEAAGYLRLVIELLPEHGEALSALLPLVAAGNPGVMDHPSTEVLIELSGRFGP